MYNNLEYKIKVIEHNVHNVLAYWIKIIHTHYAELIFWQSTAKMFLKSLSHISGIKHSQ